MPNSPTADVFNVRSEDTGSATFVKRAEAKVTFGPRVTRDTRKIAYDDLEAKRTRAVSWTAGKEDRMPVTQVKQKWQAIYVAYGVADEEDGVKEAVMNAILFNHTLNGGSILQPGRSTIRIAKQEWSYALVLEVLGNDVRRFFKTMADETRAVNQQVLNWVTSEDPYEREQYDWLIETAGERGMLRYPDLTHDTASGCKFLRPDERYAVENSKASVLSATANHADRLVMRARLGGGEGGVSDPAAFARALADK